MAEYYDGNSYFDEYEGGTNYFGGLEDYGQDEGYSHKKKSDHGDRAIMPPPLGTLRGMSGEGLYGGPNYRPMLNPVTRQPSLLTEGFDEGIPPRAVARHDHDRPWDGHRHPWPEGAIEEMQVTQFRDRQLAHGYDVHECPEGVMTDESMRLRERFPSGYPEETTREDYRYPRFMWY